MFCGWNYKFFATLFILTIHSNLNNSEKVKEWGPIHNFLENLTSSMLKIGLPFAMKVNSGLNLSDNCSLSLLQFAIGMRKMKPWAIQMLDANGKLPSGVSEGTFIELGSYDECLRAVAKNRWNATLFTGQHCLLRVKIPYEAFSGGLNIFKIVTSSTYLTREMLHDPGLMDVYEGLFGICIPSKCTNEEVKDLASKVIQHVSLPVSIKSANCETITKEIHLTNSQIGAMSFFAIIISLVIIGTITDVGILLLNGQKASKALNLNTLLKILRSFSFYSNAKMVANVSGSKSLQCLNGLRFISLLWVMLSHTFVTEVPDQISMHSRVSGHLQSSKNLLFAIVDNASPSVDTFFLISGFLLTYSTWKTLEANEGKLNVLKFLIKKYWRLTPLLCSAISLAILSPLFGSGPLWKANIDNLANTCGKNWWKNLLYIQNMYDIKDMCLSPSWYLACLMQYTILATFLLLFTFRYQRSGLIIGLALISIGSIVSIVLTGLYDLAPAPLYTSYGMEKTYKILNFQLTKPHHHVGVYIIGMATAYRFLKNKNITIRPVYQTLLWILTTACCLLVVFGVQDFRNTRTQGTFLISIYSGVSRSAWALAISWLTLACISGKGGIINSILSWPPFCFLAKLSYAAFLFHVHIIYYYISRIRTAQRFTYGDMAYRYIGHVVITFFISYFVHLMIEVPFSNLESFILTTGKKSKKLDFNQNKGADAKSVITTVSFNVFRNT